MSVTDTAPSPLVVTAPPERFFGYYPGTVAVVTAAHGGDRNVMSAGWHAALSADPPLYGVAFGRERYTYGLVRASNAFAVHFLPFERADAIAGAGSLSRHDGVDKFERLGLATSTGRVLDVPILHDAYLAYECRVDAVHTTGDHDFVVGSVVAVHHRPDAFDERRLQDGARVPGVVYYGRSTFEALGSGARGEFTPERYRERKPV
ncbi:MAG: flavin reductase family protein [Trueperaceae bacterium]|nr:MAG: flavin reductase family protein [Trueperaceae bacterium]